MGAPAGTSCAETLAAKKTGNQAASRRITGRTLCERAAFDRIVHSFLRNTETPEHLISHKPDVIYPHWACIVRVHHHLAAPVEEAHPGKKLGRFILAECNQV